MSKVLITIGLIQQSYDNKRSTLEWLGLEHMSQKLTNMLESSFARLQFELDRKGGTGSSGKKVAPCPSEFLGKRWCIDPIEAEAYIARCSL